MNVKNEAKSELNYEVVTRLVNDRGETYFVKVRTDTPVKFVRGLWESIDKFCHCQEDEYFMGELTERMMCFRTTVQTFPVGWEVCIRTHAWAPAGDKQELHSDILKYLRGHDLLV